MASLQDLILTRLCDLMSQINENESRTIAKLLTTRINAVLAGESPLSSGGVTEQNILLEMEISLALPVSMMNSSTLHLPWLAFETAYRAGVSHRSRLDDGVNIVCSMPDVVERAMRGTLAETGIWPGGILDCLAGLLAGAREEVLMVSPYWSAAGVETIARRMANHQLRGVKVKIITLPLTQHKPEALRAHSSR